MIFLARADLLNILYSKEKSPLEFNFDTMWCVPMDNMIPRYAVEKLYNIATSLRYASKIELKYDTVKHILEPFDFRKFHAGTNRVIYRHLECTDIVSKIAIDRVGMQDNPLEFNNQQNLKPFVTKTFEVSQCGTVGIAERVEPITSRLEFQSIGESIFELLTNNIIGEYVLEDIGTKFFRNWGLRKGFGPVLLDYPYMFKLDGNKLFCNKEVNLFTGELCGGVIDYDAGFNTLVCNKCGKHYQARDLQQYIQNNQINFKEEEIDNMKVEIRRGNKTIYAANEINETSVPRMNKRNNRGGNRYNSYDPDASKLQTQIIGGRNCARNLVNVENEQINRQEERAKVNTEITMKSHDTGEIIAKGLNNNVPLNHYPISTESNAEDNQPKYNTQSVFMTPPENTNEDTNVSSDEQNNNSNEMANALISDEEKKELLDNKKTDISSDDYINSKYGDLTNDDTEPYEKFNKNRKIDISNF